MTYVVARAALEAYSWFPFEADDARTLKVFIDGRSRIGAVACRKLMARQIANLELLIAEVMKLRW